MNRNIGIILIHGAGLNKTIWNDLANELKFPILAIDFPHRQGGEKATTNLSFDDYIKATTDQIKKWNENNFIIVAHSIGATVGLEVAKVFQEELKGFVALSSIIPKRKNSFASSLPFPQKIILPLLLNVNGTKPPQKTIKKELCNDLSIEQTKRIINEFTPESKTLFTTRIDIDLPATKRLYVMLKRDKSIPIPTQHKMAQNFKPNKIEIINSGHLPMISKPKHLARVIHDFINEIT